jgi:hypothetical protein
MFSLMMYSPDGKKAIFRSREALSMNCWIARESSLTPSPLTLQSRAFREFGIEASLSSRKLLAERI